MFETPFSPFDRLEVPYSGLPQTAALWSLNISIRHDAHQLTGVLDKMPLIVIPSRLLATRQADEFRAMHPNHPHVVIPDHFDARIPCGGSPMDAAMAALGQLRKGGEVVVLECTNRPSGFLPALLTMLADPGCHIEKVIYPIRYAGYDLHPDQIGFLHGLSSRVATDISGILSPKIS